MRVLYITTAVSSAEQGGWGRYSQGVAESVAAHAEVVVLTQKHSTHTSALQDVRPVLPKFGFGFVAQWRTFLAVLQHGRSCDVLHVLVEPYAPATALANLFLRKTLVLTLHGTYSVPPARFGWRKLLVSFALRSASSTTTGSTYTEQKARERVQFGECRFIPNGIDTQAFHRLPSAKTGHFFLTTGAVKPRKGQDIGVQALALLASDFPDLRYVVVGDVSNTTFVEKITESATTLGIADRVDLVGLVDEQKLLEYYNSCFVYVLAARDVAGQFEGFPMVYFEANACGAPVITTRGFGSEYAVRDGETGYLVPADDPEAVAKAIRVLLEDPALRDTLSKNALDWALQHTWPQIAEHQIIPLYRDALQK